MKISDDLNRWYIQNKRDLPWRKSRDPYAIWISEIMLQQTTVKAVIPYYERFMKEFPDAQNLARAELEKVLSLWSGLGYYSRARNLHKAAQKITELKKFPQTYNELLELPGIGPYTAAAISSIAFDEDVAVVDGNVIRVITRLFDISKNINTKEGQNLIQQKTQDLIQNQKPSIHNQAMMELGATICTPQHPTCMLCPLMKNCQGFKNQTILQRPVKNLKRKQEPWLWTMYLIKRGNKIAFTKSNGTPWLKNIWVLPGHAKPMKAKQKVRFDLKHSITHHKIFVQIEKSQASKFKNLKWFEETKLSEIGTSSVVLKALKTQGLHRSSI